MPEMQNARYVVVELTNSTLFATFRWIGEFGTSARRKNSTKREKKIFSAFGNLRNPIIFDVRTSASIYFVIFFAILILNELSIVRKHEKSKLPLPIWLIEFVSINYDLLFTECY